FFPTTIIPTRSTTPNTRNSRQWSPSVVRFRQLCRGRDDEACAHEQSEDRIRSRATGNADRAGLQADRGTHRHAAAEARAGPVGAIAFGLARDRAHTDPGSAAKA